MEKRRSIRKKVQLNAVMISGERTCTGIIGNVSERGLLILTDDEDPLSNTKSFSPGTIFEVEFHVSDMEKFVLRCEVKWSYTSVRHGMKKEVGMEVLFPPPSYRNFCKSIK